MSKWFKWCVAAVCFMALGASLAKFAIGTPSRPATEPTRAAETTPPPTRQKQHRRHRSLAVKALPKATPTASAFIACDANIRVRRETTTCPFANNVFYEFYEATLGIDASARIEAWSAASKRFYSVRCSGYPSVVCTAGDGGEVRFPSDAVAAYDDDQAKAYASTHDTGNKPVAAATSDPYTRSDAVPEYDSPDYPPESPGYGNEIPNYDEGNGYRVQCSDGMYSQSGGIQGACSGHGGVG